MVDLTLLEVNLEGAKLTANAPFSGKEGKSADGSSVSKLFSRSSDDSDGVTDRLRSEESDESGLTDTADDESAGPSLVPVLVLVGAVVLLALFRRRRNGQPESQQELVEYEQ